MNKYRLLNFILLSMGMLSFQISCTDKSNQQHFQPRKSTQCVIFKNKMWLLGGISVNESGDRIIYNDIWGSKNGKTWTLINQNFISPRENFSAITFNGKIWVIGGFDPKTNNNLNDIWCSSDGKTWKKIIENAEFGPRIAPVLIVFNKKLWLIGGEDFASKENNTDVWSSSNGINWSKETQIPVEDAFSKKGTINKNQIYIISDDFISLKTQNGSNWTFLSKESNRSRYRFELVTFKNKLFLLGGITNFSTDFYDGYCNDVLVSEDGITWKTITENQSNIPEVLDEHKSFPARGNFSAIVFQDQIFVIAGAREYEFYNDVWRSKDGKNWEQIR